MNRILKKSSHIFNITRNKEQCEINICWEKNLTIKLSRYFSIPFPYTATSVDAFSVNGASNILDFNRNVLLNSEKKYYNSSFTFDLYFHLLENTVLTRPGNFSIKIV